jgi:indole-3-glycerol phosphate synthase
MVYSYSYARGLNLEVLVEIHDFEDLTKALKSKADIIIHLTHLDLVILQLIV